MKTDCYITFTSRGVTGARKSLPTLKAGEFAVRLRMTIPDALFRPDLPTVDLNIPERAMITPIIAVIEPSPSPSAP